MIFLKHKRIISAVKRIESVNNKMCDTIVLNVHAATEEKTHDMASFYEEVEHVFEQFPMYNMKILLGDFNAKVDREDIFKPTTRNKSLHEIRGDNGVTADPSTNVPSLWSLFLMTCMTSWTGTLVKRLTTSKLTSIIETEGLQTSATVQCGPNSLQRILTL
jgi:hypothetical protein